MDLYSDDTHDSDHDSDVQKAIEASLETKVALNNEYLITDQYASVRAPGESTTATVGEVLERHVSTLSFSTCEFEDQQIVTVRRNDIWQDVKQSFSKSYTNLTLPLRVLFVGESAADQGGPKREFFSACLGGLLCRCIDVLTLCRWLTSRP